LFGAALAFGLGAGAFANRGTYGTRIRRLLGTVSVATGAAALGVAIVQVKRAGSNVNPYAPTEALVTDGAFALTRNPMYFGFTSLFIGVALLARSIPSFVMLPIALAMLDRFVVDREERYLESRFGEAYRAYEARVPRWF
jgi:protein-S-isoprenylcysteine O-methyltransferase Ste14